MTNSYITPMGSPVHVLEIRKVLSCIYRNIKVIEKNRITKHENVTTVKHSEIGIQEDFEG